jgi:sugar phosphate isomerase/epimerase
MPHPLATVAALGFPDLPPQQLLPLYRQLGCTLAQIYRNPAAPTAPMEAVRICGDAGLVVDSIHGVFGDAHDPSSPDSAIRAAAIATYRAEADYCRAAGGRIVILHPAPSKPGQAPTPPDEAAARYEHLRDTLEALAPIAQQRQIVFAVENMPPYHPIGSDVARLAAVVRAIANPHIRCCFDTGHAFMSAGAQSQPRDTVAALQAMADLIAYIHVHDNDGHGDSHLMPFDGGIDWLPLAAAWNHFSFGGLNATLMLEVFYAEALLGEKIAAGWQRRIAALSAG